MTDVNYVTFFIMHLKNFHLKKYLQLFTIGGFSAVQKQNLIINQNFIWKVYYAIFWLFFFPFRRISYTYSRINIMLMKNIFTVTKFYFKVSKIKSNLKLSICDFLSTFWQLVNYLLPELSRSRLKKSIGLSNAFDEVKIEPWE